MAYFTELILQICNYAQKRRIWCENCKYAHDENFHSHFCSRRKAAKFCHPDQGKNHNVYVYEVKVESESEKGKAKFENESEKAKVGAVEV